MESGQDLRQALITIAISIIAADQMLAHFGGVAEDVKLPASLDTSLPLHVYGLTYGRFRLLVLLVAIVVGVLLVLMFKKTRFGMIVRAGVDDRAMVSALGVNIQLVFAGAFFLGAALAGLGGVFGGTMVALGPGRIPRSSSTPSSSSSSEGWEPRRRGRRGACAGTRAVVRPALPRHRWNRLRSTRSF